MKELVKGKRMDLPGLPIPFFLDFFTGVNMFANHTYSDFLTKTHLGRKVRKTMYDIARLTPEQIQKTVPLYGKANAEVLECQKPGAIASDRLILPNISKFRTFMVNSDLYDAMRSTSHFTQDKQLVKLPFHLMEVVFQAPMIKSPTDFSVFLFDTAGFESCGGFEIEDIGLKNEDENSPHVLIVGCSHNECPPYVIMLDLDPKNKGRWGFVTKLNDEVYEDIANNAAHYASVITGLLLYINSRAPDIEVNKQPVFSSEELVKIPPKSRGRQSSGNHSIWLGKNFQLDANIKRISGDSARTIAHKFMVRGHWRNQRVGFQRQETKIIWIQPHWKGPDMAEVLNKGYKVI